MCDQDDHVVPAHQVDDIDEVHELDPVHRATSGDFCATLGQKKQKKQHKYKQMIKHDKKIQKWSKNPAKIDKKKSAKK